MLLERILFASVKRNQKKLPSVYKNMRLTDLDLSG